MFSTRGGEDGVGPGVSELGLSHVLVLRPTEPEDVMINSMSWDAKLKRIKVSQRNLHHAQKLQGEENENLKSRIMHTQKTVAVRTLIICHNKWVPPV